MRGLPVTMNLEAATVLVVGGGEAAAQKLRLALEAGGRIVVVAEEVTPEIAALAETGRIDWRRRGFLAPDLDGTALIFIALPEEDAAPIAALAKARHLPVNVVDRPALSSFHMPAIVDRGTVTVAIATEGTAPALARHLRRQIEALLPARLDRLASWLARWRERLPSDRRRVLFDRWIDGPVADLVLSGHEDEADRAAARDATDKALGLIQLVGAGPGDPDLLTVAALRALGNADVVFHDALVPDAILSRIRRDATRVYVGKVRGCHSVAQDAIAERMIEAAQAGKRVVRLKGGDPFIFGRGGEEMLAAERAGVPVAIIPGITAALGCAAAAGIPLTHRRMAGAVTLVTGHRAKDGTPIDWGVLARHDRTLAIYMGRDEAASITSELIAAGLPAGTPVALIENGTRPDMRIDSVYLGDLPACAATLGDGPSLIIVGEVVRLSAAWREPSRLAAE